MNKKVLLPMLFMVLASVFLGLGANFISRQPLPLFRALPAAAPALPVSAYGEADADLVRQLSADPAVVLLDARTAENFASGRIPGAVSLPVSRFDEIFPLRRERLQAARMLVVYCSGRTCSDSQQLAARLWRQGLKTLLLYQGGMEDWLEKGNAVEK